MSLFSTEDKAVKVEEQGDNLGGGQRIEGTDVYPAKIEMAYIDIAKSGAVGVVVHYKTASGALHRETQYIKSGDAKGNKHYYVKDGNQYNLPGFNTINAVTNLAGDDGFNLLDVEEHIEKKVIKVYDFEAKKELPQEKLVIIPLIGKDITIAIQEILEDKTAKNDQGKYIPTGEHRTKFEIAHVFHSDTGMTVSETKAAMKDESLVAEFQAKWLEKNQGKVRDKTDKKAAKANAAGGGAQSGAPKQSTDALFED